MTRYALLTVSIIGLLVVATVAFGYTCAAKCKVNVPAAYSGFKIECSSETTSSITGEVTGVGGGAVSGEGTAQAICVLSYEVVPSHYNCTDAGDWEEAYCDFQGGQAVTQHNYTGGLCVYHNPLFGASYWTCKDLADETTPVENASGDACPV